MELTNKRVSYSISNENDNLKMTGDVSVNSNNEISSFNGQIMNLEGMMIGNFYYSEMDGKINKNFNNVDFENEEIVCEALRETVKEIKTKIAE